MQCSAVHAVCLTPHGQYAQGVFQVSMEEKCHMYSGVLLLGVAYELNQSFMVMTKSISMESMQLPYRGSIRRWLKMTSGVGGECY